jgi:hypothetical protein
MDTGKDQATDVGDVGNKIGPDFAGDGSHGVEVEVPGTGRRTDPDQLWALAAGCLVQAVVVDPLGLWEAMAR